MSTAYYKLIISFLTCFSPYLLLVFTRISLRLGKFYSFLIYLYYLSSITTLLIYSTQGHKWRMRKSLYLRKSSVKGFLSILILVSTNILLRLSRNLQKNLPLVNFILLLDRLNQSKVLFTGRNSLSTIVIRLYCRNIISSLGNLDKSGTNCKLLYERSNSISLGRSMFKLFTKFLLAFTLFSPRKFCTQSIFFSLLLDIFILYSFSIYKIRDSVSPFRLTN